MKKRVERWIALLICFCIWSSNKDSSVVFNIDFRTGISNNFLNNFSA